MWREGGGCWLLVYAWMGFRTTWLIWMSGSEGFGGGFVLVAVGAGLLGGWLWISVAQLRPGGVGTNRRVAGATDFQAETDAKAGF